jgi:hypothetical protein
MARADETPQDLCDVPFYIARKSAGVRMTDPINPNPANPNPANPNPVNQRDLTNRTQRHPEKAHRADNPSPKKPDWIRVRAPNSKGFFQTRNVIKEHGLSTVCQEAGCPNVGE